MPSVRASISNSFDGLTISVAVPLDPKFLRTTYGGVTATGSTTKELHDPNILHRETDDSDSREELPNTKKRLPGDFVLKNNTVGHELPTLALEVDRTRFRMFYIAACEVMSDYFIPIPIDHFLAGLSIPLDPTFCDFLTMIRSQSTHVTRTELGTSWP